MYSRKCQLTRVKGGVTMAAVKHSTHGRFPLPVETFHLSATVRHSATRRIDAFACLDSINWPVSSLFVQCRHVLLCVKVLRIQVKTLPLHSPYDIVDKG